ncbi:phospho-acceptor domain-containing protein [Dyadobacter jejuensis]|uniref:histidine kinase n=1 Tax=Dyadobacter jejuensis TaxID=1082580 RepID=A0A316AQ36_9BACT|nr:phospho-acceptor domain-containing protein [Dyadobacter jejuensis]
MAAILQAPPFLCILVALLYGSSYGQSPESSSHPASVSFATSYFVDSTASLALNDIKGEAFSPISSSNFRVPFSSHSIWFRCVVQNPTSAEQRYYFEWQSPMIERIDYYSPDSSGQYWRQRGGNLVDKEARSYLENSPTFAIDLPPDSATTVYFRINNQRGFRSDLRLHTPTQLLKAQLSHAKLFSFFSGLIFIRLFFVLLLSIFAIKEFTFRRYSLMIVFRSLAFWGIIAVLGSTLSSLPKAQVVINFLSYHLLPIGYFLLIKALVPLDRFPAMVSRLIHLLLAITIALSLAIVMDYQWRWLLASTYLVITCQGLIMVLYLVAIYRKYPINWYYSAPFLLGMISYSCLLVNLVGWLNFEWVFVAGTILFILEIFVFGLFLGKIIMDYQSAKDNSERALEVNRLKTQNLQELDRLKTNFFTNISHEFRSPLTLLIEPLNDLSKKHPEETLLPIMQRNVRRLHALINQLLDLSKLDAGHLKPYIQFSNLSDFLRQLFASYESMAQSKEIIFLHEQQEPNRFAYFDADKLEKIVTNLLSNAIKFTPQQGRVMVRANYSEKELHLTIQDYGIGISEEALPHIFDRYFQTSPTKKEHTGTGIGLALVKELVGVLNGTIEVSSTLHQGTRFSIRLPIDAHSWGQSTPIVESPWSHPPVGEAVLEGEPTDSPSDNRPIVLLVEDNPDLSTYIQSLFQDQYRVLSAANGQEGWTMATDKIPDLILSDVMMPLMDGYTLCERLKADQRTSHIPIILLTAKVTLEDKLAGLSLGADDYLAKPFSRQELTIRVKNLLQQRQKLHEAFHRMLTQAPSQESTPEFSQMESKFLQAAIEIVKSHLHESSFNVDEFASEMKISRTNLHRKLKALSNQSTTEFIRTIRLNKAAELLRKEELTVSETAYAVGYESLSYFSKSFKEQFGVSPSEWALHK